MTRICLLLLLSIASARLLAAPAGAVYSPAPHVLCDRHVCVDDSEGVSRALTQQYLGKKAADKVFSRGDFDHSAFTLSNGVFCDVNERLCHRDRYFGADGKRSAVDRKYTRLLFGDRAKPMQ